MISVIIPARNAATTIATTLSTLVPDKALIGEILLIDDGSTDGTVARAMDVAAAHALPLSVTSVRFANAGAARNAGLVKASGDCVFFLDADDELITGGLARLYEGLESSPGAGLAVGSFTRRTRGLPDVTKLPGSYADNRKQNAERYLRNELRSIAIGSALFVFSKVQDIRFPGSITLDEDTCYWTALLTRLDVVTVKEPVMVYNVDEKRMIDRFATDSRAMFLCTALVLNDLERFGVGRDTVQWRKAWLAQRMARMLSKRQRYDEADRMMRVARVHAGFRWTLRFMRYRARIRFGKARLGLAPPRGSRS